MSHRNRMPHPSRGGTYTHQGDTLVRDTPASTEPAPKAAPQSPRAPRAAVAEPVAAPRQKSPPRAARGGKSRK